MKEHNTQLGHLDEHEREDGDSRNDGYDGGDGGNPERRLGRRMGSIRRACEDYLQCRIIGEVGPMLVAECDGDVDGDNDGIGR